MANTNFNGTKVVTGLNTRLSYVHLLEPAAPLGGGKEKYSASISIPKSDTKTLAQIEAAIQNAVKNNLEKFGGKMPNMKAIKTPLRDGDVERDDAAYQDSHFLNANSISKPQIVDRHLQPILDPEEIYSGMYARVSLNFYAFNVNGNRGVACGLGNVQKVRDGERFVGNSSASDDFTSLDDDNDFLA